MDLHFRRLNGMHTACTYFIPSAEYRTVYASPLEEDRYREKEEDLQLKEKINQ